MLNVSLALEQLKSRQRELADNLNRKGVEASESDTMAVLVGKILRIESAERTPPIRSITEKVVSLPEKLVIGERFAVEIMEV